MKIQNPPILKGNSMSKVILQVYYECSEGYNYEVISWLNTNNADKNYNARKLLWLMFALKKEKC